MTDPIIPFYWNPSDTVVPYKVSDAPLPMQGDLIKPVPVSAPKAATPAVSVVPAGRDSSLDRLFPPFAEQLLKFDAKIKQAGMPAFRFETYRDFKTQLEYYKKGRSYNAATKVWTVVDPKLIVTKAVPGLSAHNYGLAVDFAFDGNSQKTGIQWTWDDLDATKQGLQTLPWKELGAIGKSCGLEWAGDWKGFTEFPHFQNIYGFQIHHLCDMLMSTDLASVWKEILKTI